MQDGCDRRTGPMAEIATRAVNVAVAATPNLRICADSEAVLPCATLPPETQQWDWERVSVSGSEREVGDSMGEALNLEDITFGELKKRLEKDPKLADRVPAVKRFISSFRGAMPAFQGLRLPIIDEIAEALTRIGAPLRATGNLVPSTDRVRAKDSTDFIQEWMKTLPGPGLLTPPAESHNKVEDEREIAQLNAKIDELTALVRLQAVLPPIIDAVAEPADGGSRSQEKSKSAGDQKTRTRVPGRPTRKKEILQLLEARRVARLIEPRLAAEARQIRKTLRDRYKDGLHADEPPIPSVDTIENIIRTPYRVLKERRNGPKRFVA